MNQKRPTLYQDGDQYLVDIGAGYRIAWRVFQDTDGDAHFHVMIHTPPGAHIEATHGGGAIASQENAALLRRDLAYLDELYAACIEAARKGDTDAIAIIRKIVSHRTTLRAAAGLPDSPVPNIIKH